MVNYSYEMRQYDNVCAMLTAANIAYTEKQVDKYKVTFTLTKDGKSAELTVDCSSAYAEEQTQYGIKAFESFLNMSV